MKIKKAIAMLLALIMIFSLCACDSNVTNPTENTNDSGDDTVQDDDIEITNCTKVKTGIVNLSDYSTNISITSGGEYTLSGSFKNKIVYVDANDDVTIILSDAVLENSDGPCIFVRDADKVTIKLANGSSNAMIMSGNSTYTALDATIYSKCDLEFTGDGMLTIQSDIGHAIKSKDNVTVESGTYAIDALSDCINVNDDLIINGGTFTLSSEEDEGLQSDTNLTINGGTFEIDTAGDAIRAEVLLTINNGDINITNAGEGLESKDQMVINGGTLNLNTTDDCINAINSLIVNGGTIHAVSATNDAIDSNGTLVINDGYIYAVGMTTPEGAIDCDNKGLAINGGTVIGLGTANTQSNDGTQNMLLVSLSTTDIIEKTTIKDENGNVVFECEIDAYTSGNGMFGQGQLDQEIPSDMMPGGNIGEQMPGQNMDGTGEMTPPEGMEMPDGTMPDGMGMPGDMQVPDSTVPEGEIDATIPQDQGQTQWPNNGSFGNRGDGNTDMSGKGDKENSMGGGRFNTTGAASLIISFPELTNGTYSVYINDELVGTVNVQTTVTAIGQSTTMPGMKF